MALGLRALARVGIHHGAFGAGMSIYSNFLARATESSSKNTAMDVGVGTRKKALTAVAAPGPPWQKKMNAAHKYKGTQTSSGSLRALRAE